ncbi:ABC transporter substrate-binding protein, partial [Streptomyces sp. 2MCAF27]
MTASPLPSSRSGRPWRRPVPGSLATAALAGVLAATSLTGCSSNDDSASDGGPVTLQFWTYSVKGGDPAAKAIVDRYHQEHPNVTIKLSEVGGTAETASKLLAADRADDTPDVVQLEYRALPSLVVAGAVKDITKDVASVKNKIEPNIWDLTTLNDQVYGVPQDIGPMMFTYRKDLFAKYGVKVPTTWAEYAGAAEQIHKKDPDAYIASFSASQFE